MKELAQDPAKLTAILRQVYGEKLGPERTAQLVEQAKQGEMPLPANVQFVDDAVLQGNNAAYSPENGGTVYLNKKLAGDPEALQQAFNEECGHHLDRVLGGKDTRGDEGGALQTAMAKKDVLSPAELAVSRNDRDQGTIAVAGRQVPVEFQAPAADQAVQDVSQLMERSASDWAITDTDARTAVEKLGTLDRTELNQALSKMGPWSWYRPATVPFDSAQGTGAPAG